MCEDTPKDPHQSVAQVSEPPEISHFDAIRGKISDIKGRIKQMNKLFDGQKKLTDLEQHIAEKKAKERVAKRKAQKAARKRQRKRK